MSKFPIQFMNQLAEEFEAQGWEFRWQFTLIEPIEPEPLDEGRPIEPGPRTNIVISQAPATVDSADAAAAEFLEQTQSAIPLVVENGPASLSFADGVVGSELTISFPATPTVTLVQIHMFRHDDGLMTQLVITTDTFGFSGDPNKIADLKDKALRLIVGTTGPPAR